MARSAELEPTQPSILVVDDRRENLLATEKVLRPLNATIHKALSGNEALSLMLRHRFAVVLLDVQMPEMDGFEVAVLMQEHEAMQGVPIIFVTAISKEERYANQAAELGAVDYIFKPINPEILKSKVKVYLDLYVQHEQISRLNSVLRQSNEELERFAYICSHDMQEPVRMMNSYAGLLRESLPDGLDGSCARYLDRISESAGQLHRMIRDILVFSRVGREEVRLETVDCNRVLREVLADLAGPIAERGARVTCGELPVLLTSASAVRVLLQNLVGNGLKFQDGERVPEVAVEAEPQGSSWRFCVRDNGIGIDPRYRDKVFTIFQRLHRKEDYPGTGIGLSTAKKLVELCGGRIWFESDLAQGSRFYFTLPRDVAGP